MKWNLFVKGYVYVCMYVCIHISIANNIFDLLNFQYFPRFMVEASNAVDGSKPARTLLASLCVILLAATELIDLVGLSYKRAPKTFTFFS